MNRKLLVPVVLASAASLFSVNAAAQDVLVYDDNTEDQVAQTACTNLGYTCTVANSTNFNSLLTGSEWDLVVMDLPSTRPDGDWQGLLGAYIAGGGRVIQSGWSESDFVTLAADFEVVIAGSHQPIEIEGNRGAYIALH